MKNHAKASTFAIRTSQPHKAKIAKELALPTHHDTTKMDRQTTYREEGRTANKVLPKAGLNGFDWTFMQGSTFVLRLNFSTKNSRLRQYPKRYLQLFENHYSNSNFINICNFSELQKENIVRN